MLVYVLRLKACYLASICCFHPHLKICLTSSFHLSHQSHLHLLLHLDKNPFPMEEQSCRICRGEATETQPLLHPCKCKGLIRYIHQDCLVEWLNHSNKNTKQCDICNTPYVFTTIYDPDMPDRVPIFEILRKLVSDTVGHLATYTLIALYAVCVFQVPVFWMFLGRVFTYAADGKLPSPELSWKQIVLYGATKPTLIKDPLVPNSEETPTWTFLPLRLNYPPGFQVIAPFFSETFAVGVVYVASFVVLLAVIFIEHEWVIREEGYTKLLLRQIGKEPRTKLADLLQQIARDPQGNNATVARALADLRQDPPPPQHNQALHQAVEENEFAELMEHQGDAPAAPGHPEMDLAHFYDDNGSDNGSEPEEEMERRNNVAEAEIAAAEAAVNNDVLLFLGIEFNLLTPVQLMILADFAILFFMFNAYLVPHVVGNFFLVVVGVVALGLYGVFVKPLTELGPVAEAISAVYRAYLNLRGLSMVFAHICCIWQTMVWRPVVEPVIAICTVERTSTPTNFERVLLVSTGYALACFAMASFMNLLVAGPKPITGNARKVYKVLFRIKCTAKVFAIFAIEILVFPIFCGMLLGFCLAPLTVKDLVSRSVVDGIPVYDYTLQIYTGMGWPTDGFVRLLGMWSLGTSYMLLVALFVGMARTRILRPGVLFFIKSPEDPNAHLIHDAVVKPFMLQILRIFLSAKVYTAFILLGIGTVTWGIRFFVNPPGSETPLLLPIKISSMSPLAVIAGYAMSRAWGELRAYFFSFWREAFIALCFKLRLSNFILTLTVPQERGYVVYRNLWHRVLATAVPDYRNPVARDDTAAHFAQNDNVNAVFVPDGSYVRAPASDDNSRRFIRTLFIPVTRNDQLLAEIPEESEHEADWWEEDLVFEDKYTVVYRPPNLQVRCLTLVCMICVIGALLAVCGVLICGISGRMVVRAFAIVVDRVASLAGKEPYFAAFEWQYLDLDSLSAGVIMACVGVMWRANPIFAARDRNAMNIGRRMAGGVVAAGASRLLKNFGILLTATLQTVAWTCVRVSVELLLELKWPGAVANSGGWMLYGVSSSRALFTLWNIPWMDMFSDRTSRSVLKELVLSAAWNSVLVALQFVLKTSDSAQFQTACHALVLVIGILPPVLMALSSVYRRINDQIRKEKYLRGTSIENMNFTDDEPETSVDIVAEQ